MSEATSLPRYSAGDCQDIAYALSDVLTGLNQAEQDDLNWWLRYRTCPELPDGSPAIYIVDYRDWLTDRFQRTIR